MKRFRQIANTLLIILMLSGAALGAEPEDERIEQIILTITLGSQLPPPVRDGLQSVISSTLRDVLISSRPGGLSAIRSHAGEISTAILEGLNFVLEPKGFHVKEINLQPGRATDVEITIIPAGGADSEPGPVCTDVELSLSAAELPGFWLEIMNRKLLLVRDDAKEYYSTYLLGLPLAATDESFILESIEPYIEDTALLDEAFPEFEIRVELELGTTSRVTICLDARGELVRTLRVRMSGDTVPNVVLDSLREAITSHSNIAVGMPVSLVKDNYRRIGERFASLIEADPLAEAFDAKSRVVFAYEEADNSLVAVCDVRSGLYEVNLRGYIDFGNEDADSSEVEARLGYFFFEDIELMVVLNLFTNDMTLEPDALIGWRPREGTFIGAGWDIDASSEKFFFSQKLVQKFYIEGEVFEENERNQFGVYYRFHQYFNGGLYATGDGDYWFRTTFRL